MANYPNPPQKPGYGTPPPYGQNPYQANPYGSPPGGYGGGPPPRSGGTPGKVLAPAITMIVFGVIDFGYGILNLVGTLMAVGQPPEPIPPELAGNEFWEEFYNGMNNPDPTAGIVVSAIMMLMALILIVGGAQMARCRMYALAITAAIIAILPCGVMDCCLLAECGVGIWAVVVLCDNYVKSIFR